MSPRSVPLNARGFRRMGQLAPHGTTTGFRNGCKCPLCTEASRAAARARYAAAKVGEVRPKRRKGHRPPALSLDAKRELALKVAAQTQVQAEREAVFLAIDLGSDSRVCACPNGHSIGAHDFRTNFYGACIAVCPRCDWHAPAASTRGAA